MNTTRRSPLPWHWILPGFCLLLSGAPAPAQSSQPTITSVRIENTNVVVTARVPSGIHKITLECRERLGAGSWEPRAVRRLDGSGATITFQLPASRSLEVLRVRADASDPLPPSFYSGTNEFFSQPADGTGPRLPGNVDLGVAGPGPATPAADSSREVIESDIWKIRGNTLYFFNQLRGLQIIDITNPDTASVRGTLELPAAGEDMYTLGSAHVVLLARAGCSSADSQVIVIADNAGTPSIAARLPVPGYIIQSRLVGSALYVASASYRPVAGTNTWEWGTLVSSYDLSAPAAPVARGTLWYPGYGNVVSATDRLLFVVTQDPGNWWQSIVRAIDITAPNGAMNDYQTIRTAGRVPDKFKLNWDGSVLTTISEDWRSTPGRNVTTRLETWRLPDPRSAGPAGLIRLGQLELGRGEQLHATRFDGNRVYIVTFFRIDPLWVVDLSNSSAPRIAGSVDVPGWSTFIQPVGSKLVTIGYETNRVVVSLFDVANPAAPSLLSRARVGQNFAWTEANWDEKSFTVLPEAGLILVPYSGDSTANGWVSRVQLIDLNATSLAARGVIDHALTPRRTTLHGQRVLSLSGWELLSVDATDRDHPSVRGNLTLAWPVDRVFVEGAHLLEISSGNNSGWWWNSSGSAIVRSALATTPNQILNQLALDPLPIVGANVHAGRLYIAQAPQAGFYPIPVADGGGNQDATPKTKFILTIIDLDHLPALSIVARVETALTGNGWDYGVSGNFQAVWPRSDTLVWSGGGYNFWWLDTVRGASPMVADGLFFPWWGGGSGGQLVAFDLTRPTAPQFASEVNLNTNNWWSFSDTFTADGLVYLSHQTSEWFPWLTPFDSAGAGADGIVGPIPIGSWATRQCLDVVDYADARNPLVRRPVSIPGELHGISHQGAVLYTVGPTWTEKTQFNWRDYLAASAYDGVSAHLIDSIPLSDSWPHPVRVSGADLFVGQPSYTSDTPSLLQTWSLSAGGRLTLAGKVNLTSPVYTLASFGALLAAQQSDNTLTLFDTTDGRGLRQVGQSRLSGCYSADLAHADGELGRGLWLPLGAYGVSFAPASP